MLGLYLSVAAIAPFAPALGKALLVVGMALQAAHFAYPADERAFLSEPAFFNGESRLKVGLIPEKCYRKSDVYLWTRTHSGALCENWS